jgi:hypothetical protein
MLKQRETAFRQMDKDKNGTLSLAEFNDGGSDPQAECCPADCAA